VITKQAAMSGKKIIGPKSFQKGFSNKNNIPQRTRHIIRNNYLQLYFLVSNASLIRKFAPIILQMLARDLAR
jgi:hypothetical protein